MDEEFRATLVYFLMVLGEVTSFLQVPQSPYQVPYQSQNSYEIPFGQLADQSALLQPANFQTSVGMQQPQVELQQKQMELSQNQLTQMELAQKLASQIQPYQFLVPQMQPTQMESPQNMQPSQVQLPQIIQQMMGQPQMEQPKMFTQQLPQQQYMEAPQTFTQQLPQQQYMEAPQMFTQQLPQQQYMEAPQLYTQQLPQQQYMEAPQMFTQQVPQQQYREAPQNQLAQMLAQYSLPQTQQSQLLAPQMQLPQMESSQILNPQFSATQNIQPFQMQLPQTIQQMVGQPGANYRPGFMCHNDASCPMNRVCKDGVCVNPCLRKKCGDNAICTVVNHERHCCCPPGYEGSAYTICVPKLSNITTITSITEEWYISIQQQTVCSLMPRSLIDGRCTRDCECDASESCIQGRCFDACMATRCGENAFCVLVNHKPLCACKSLYTGNPYIKCFISPGILDTRSLTPFATCDLMKRRECPNSYSCLEGKCIEPCNIPDACPKTASCSVQVVGEEIFSCTCPNGMLGNPYIACKTPVEVVTVADYSCTVRNDGYCTRDCHCSENKICGDNKMCEDACLYKSCGRNAFCAATEHIAFCFCKPGFVGDPNDICDRLSGQVCGAAEIMCYSDKDCPDHLSCTQNRCVWPCSNLVCGNNAVCIVENHQPSCECMTGYIGSPQIGCTVSYCLSDLECGKNYVCGQDRRCRIKIVEQPMCLIDTDCPLDAVCSNGKCINSCTAGSCQELGSFYTCQIINHKPMCVPNNIIIPAIPFKPAECRSDNDCALHLQCFDGRCLSPCYEEKCPKSACITINHQADCYTGILIPMFCFSDAACPSHLACINNRCVSPCSSGICDVWDRSFVCRVADHIPLCVATIPIPQMPFIPMPQLASSTMVWPTGSTSISNFIGLPSQPCTVVFQCKPGYICRNGECINPCLTPNICLPGTVCEVINNEAWCILQKSPVVQQPTPPQNLLVPVLQQSCVSPVNCKPNEICSNGTCINPCSTPNICPWGTTCDVVNYEIICRQQKTASDCLNDYDCPVGLLCHEYKKCYNPCDFISCEMELGHSHNVQCLVFNRQTICQVNTCYSDLDCHGEYRCLPVNGVNVCSVASTSKVIVCRAHTDCPGSYMCGENFICVQRTNIKRPVSGIGVIAPISWPMLQFPVPSVKPLLPAVSPGECFTNSNCDANSVCKDKKCIPSCSLMNCPQMFDQGSECFVDQRMPICRLRGFNFCNSDNDCPWYLTCVPSVRPGANICIDPCASASCLSFNTTCIVQNHKAFCWSQSKYCNWDGDCESHESCMTGNCIDPCKQTSCPSTYQCRSNLHIACCTKIIETPNFPVMNFRSTDFGTQNQTLGAQN